MENLHSKIVQILQGAENFCCFCLKDDIKSIDVYLNDQNISINVFTQVSEAFGVQGTEELLSRQVCADCKKAINSAYNFIKTVKDTRKKITEFINNIEEKITTFSNGIRETNHSFSNVILHMDSKLSEDYKMMLFNDRKINSQESTDSEIENPEDKEKIATILHVNRYHLNYFPYLCKHCGADFTSQRSQLCHMINHHQKKYYCQFCDNSFVNQQNLELHTANCVNVKRLYRCQICSASFDTIKNLDSHKNRHSRHECKQCDKNFTTKHSLLMHLKAHFNKDKRNHTTANKLNKNKSTKLKPLVKVRKCYICPEQFEKSKDLFNHLQTKHRTDEIYKCDLCKKVFPSRNYFLSHIKSSTHKRKENPNFAPLFKCNDCGVAYDTTLLLERHRNARHLKILPYTCEECGKAFAAKVNLRMHIIRHSKQRNYQCNFCSDFFTEPTGLKSHILRHHAPEKKKCACEKCGKTFISLSECKMHQLRQHSEKNFNCPLCEGKYHTNPNLRGHIKKVHFRMKSLAEYMKDNEISKEVQEVFRDRRVPCIVKT